MLSDRSAARRRLESLGPERMRPGLERIQALLARLGDPHLACPSAIVAGTNGKGSTVAMLGAIGRAAGIRVGCYTSPHLTALEERFHVGGHPISREGLDRHLEGVLAAADALVGEGALATLPSYFEILTAVAFRYFAEARVDLAVLEVGLGGRLDATNVTSPRVAVITTIDVDHADWLGDDIAQIAQEKFAVVPVGGMAVVAPQVPVVAARIRQLAAERHATLLVADSYPVVIRGHDERLRFTFDLDGRLRDYRGMVLRLPGRHQVDNARCAILATEALDRRRLRIPPEAAWDGLRGAYLPGRCHWVEGSPALLLDGAHNPSAARRLAEYLQGLREQRAFRRLHLLIGVLADKDVAGVARHLFPLFDSVVTTRPPSGRAADPKAVLRAAPAPAGAAAIAEPEAALARVLETAGPGDLVCITGSLYLLGRLRPLVEPLG